MKRLFYILIFSFYLGTSFSQFTGGSMDGYDSEINLNTISIYTGGSSDGFNSNQLINSTSIYTGGHDDGFASSEQINSTSIYSGGDEDGYQSDKLKNNISIYMGTINDGYAASTFENSVSIYGGGLNDGYAMDKSILSYIWTGLVDEKWNEIGNWQAAIIPNLNSNVVIPSGVPNFPQLSGGLMSIGQNPNGGLFFCKRINIQQGAEMTYSSSAFLENYGLMEIRGTVYVKNVSTNAFVTGSAGILNIFNQGKLIFH